MSNASEKLERAKKNEADKARDLEHAAISFARSLNGLSATDSTESAQRDLKSAAKAWTNAYHQRSRCEKHVRDSENGRATR